MTKVALDKEMTASYTVMVTATDPYFVTDSTTNRGADTIEVTITVTNVEEDPEVTGDASPAYAETPSDEVEIETYMGADDEDGEGAAP